VNPAGDAKKLQHLRDETQRGVIFGGISGEQKQLMRTDLRRHANGFWLTQFLDVRTPPERT